MKYFLNLKEFCTFFLTLCWHLPFSLEYIYFVSGIRDHFFSSELSQNTLSVSSGKHGKQYSQTKVTKSEKCLMEISYAALKIIINFLYEHFPSIRQKLLHIMKSCFIYKFWGHAAILKVLISGRGSYNKVIFQHFIKSTIHT